MANNQITSAIHTACV